MPQATRRLSRHVLSLLMALAGAGGHCHRAAAQPGYFAKAPVTGETDLDWAYPLVGHSPVDPPRELLAGYRSEATRYEFFAPAQSGAAPLLIFVSPKDRPVGWMFFEETCRTRGILFAGLHDMGNGRPAAHRVRAVLDVLSDLRERFPVDPDRTYLAGFSGGAQVACVTALALPEYFGGVLCFGHASRPPQEPWLLDRVRGRLSMAIICGARDQAATLAENVYVPLWEGVGARVRLEVVRGMGHTMPAPGVCDAALAWAEEGAAARRAWADAHP
ncbi:MAG TPA: hypothetical protein VEQ85_11260, partial [Lacipirellulaceae bacterium]|nr:hypothetical protein [Lacipirellulaceae bacterium]